MFEGLERHQCMIYDGPPSRTLAALTAAFQSKLAAGMRCLYFNSPAMIAGLLHRWSLSASMGMPGCLPCRPTPVSDAAASHSSAFINAMLSRANPHYISARTHHERADRAPLLTEALAMLLAMT